MFRWGGEEFVVLMPHTGPGEARVLGERIQAAVAERPFPATEARPMVTVTVSVGVAGSSNWPIDPDALASADAACYKAKARGRNRFELDAPTVGDVLRALPVANLVLDERGGLRPLVNVYVEGIDVRDRDGLHTALSGDEEIRLVAAIAGGG